MLIKRKGIKPTATLLEDDVDENGDLLPPHLDTINVNLLGCMYTVKLGIHYIKQNPRGGSIVMTGSGSSMSSPPPNFSLKTFYSTCMGFIILLKCTP